jgi:pyruvate formate lyase activating enzyme
MIPVKGFQKTSMIDYPGKMSSVLFLGDCNFRCPYCQNPDLITKNLPDMKLDKIMDYLKNKRNWVDGVCITGGEPTIHKDLPGFCKQLKDEGFLVKLDTNGTNPSMVKTLLKDKLLDFIAMDIKGPLEKYDTIAAVKVNRGVIQESVNLIRGSGLDYEFRTTVLPRLLKKEDLLAVGRWLKGSKIYALQQFRAMITLDKSYEKEASYSEGEMIAFGQMLEPYFEKVEVRV